MQHWERRRASITWLGLHGGCGAGYIPDMISLGILGSGSGSNMQAILDAITAGRLDARISIVLSDNPDARILERARKNGIPAGVIGCGGHRMKFPEEAQVETAVSKAIFDNEKRLREQGAAMHAMQKKGMDEAQITGACSAYARKYALCGLFAIDDSADDPDGKDNRRSLEDAAEMAHNRAVTDAQVMLENADSLADLQAVWKKLSPAVQKETAVIAAKDARKNALTPQKDAA